MIRFFLNFKQLDKQRLIYQNISKYTSDRKIVSLKVALNETEWGPGCCKINNKIINDSKYITLIENTVKEFCINNPKGHMSSYLLWKILNCVIRGKTTRYCSQKKKKN